MGQTESTEVSQTPSHTKENTEEESYNRFYISNDILKKNFSSLEEYSLRNTFENLESVNNGKEIIEEEAFIKYLGIPDEIGIGPILYRSFTYLASYPSPAHEGNLLTYDGLVIAVAIYCDKIQDVILEDRAKLIFESFAVHEEHSDIGIIPKTGVSYLPEVAKKNFDNTDNTEGSSNMQKSDTTNDVGSLKIESINFDDDAEFFKAIGFQQQIDDNPYIVSKVLCTDMLTILTGLVWLLTNEMIPGSIESLKFFSNDESESSKNIDQIRNAVTPVVEHMARYDTNLRNLPCSQIFSSQNYINWSNFKNFIQRNTPRIFNAFKPFFYGQFLIGQTLSQNRKKSLVIGSHIKLLPKLDEVSECLNQNNLALLSWTLPEEVLKRKKWNYLYSGSKHGFSMNRFVNHVFKYNGPTLMLIKAELTTNSKEQHHHTYHEKTLPNSSPKKNILLIGAYINTKWQSTSSPRTCFGSAECHLFELYPTFELFPASNRNKNYVYFNPVFGIGFGGFATSGLTSSKIESMDKNSFVIQLDSSLQYGRYRNDVLQDVTPTYNVSVTRPFFDMSFDVLEIEVVGMGAEGARENQMREWKWEEKESGRRSTRRKESLDREILKLAGIIDDREIERREP